MAALVVRREWLHVRQVPHAVGHSGLCLNNKQLNTMYFLLAIFTCIYNTICNTYAQITKKEIA